MTGWFGRFKEDHPFRYHSVEFTIEAGHSLSVPVKVSVDVFDESNAGVVKMGFRGEQGVWLSENEAIALVEAVSEGLLVYRTNNPKGVSRPTL